MPTSFDSAYEIKSAELSLVALWLRTADLQVLQQALQSQLADTPGFFDQDPVLVDLSELPQGVHDAVPDFKALGVLLASHQLRLVAFRGIEGAWREAALQAGLVDGSDARIRQLGPAFVQGHFQFFHKQALAPHLAQCPVQNLVTQGGHAQQLHPVALRRQQGLHMLGLPERQAAFTGGDGEVEGGCGHGHGPESGDSL